MAQAVANEQVIEQYGPYGSQLPENYRVQLADGEHFTKLTVDSGFVVDGIKFEIAKPDGRTRTVQIGGSGPPSSTHFVNKIVLKNGEYLTRVSGTYGYDRDRKQVGVATLKIHTNLNPQGYGPYGKGKNVDNLTCFSSPNKTDSPVVGVFGRCNANIESIGVLLRKL
ncbi:protein GOS9-like [Beta vulgaris subsp. vulgaris]|uniref:protein GOS9-like n=1 Tax=Beta vulgaris subsp. vulgaris TaxID=3555 RepID=UPI0020376276|nr:protein GOS9-like [Beta vulgaris subsp. vulgaris]